MAREREAGLPASDREEGLGAAPEATEAAPECGDPRAELCAEWSERALGDGFRADTLSGGGPMRVLAVIDVYTTHASA